MIISLKHGAAGEKDRGSKKKTYELAKKFIRQFKEMNHSITCRDLIGFDIGEKEKLTPGDWEIISGQCPEYILNAAAILEEIV